jgi:hypothetical protein
VIERDANAVVRVGNDAVATFLGSRQRSRPPRRKILSPYTGGGLRRVSPNGDVDSIDLAGQDRRTCQLAASEKAFLDGTGEAWLSEERGFRGLAHAGVVHDLDVRRSSFQTVEEAGGVNRRDERAP